MINNINDVDLNAKMRDLQAQVDNFNKMKQIQPQPADAKTITSTYPRTFRSDTVEDILNNPKWQQELAVEFNDSELGEKAKKYTELLFMEFCEKQTGKESVTLAEIRKNTKPVSAKSSAPKATDDAVG